MKTLLFCLGLWAWLPLQGQFADFAVDTLQFDRSGGPDRERMQAMRWQLNGQEVRYGSPAARIAVNPEKLDTLLFQIEAGKDWDTILCNVTQAGSYRFSYNACCGAFDLIDVQTQRRTVPALTAALSWKGEQSYLATLGEAGIWVTSTSEDTLYPACRSAMSSNIIPVSFQEIEICTDDINCEKGTCLKTEEDFDYDFAYHIKKSHLDILWMPLGQPLRVSFDPQTSKISIQ